jgi:hypothetical protein
MASNRGPIPTLCIYNNLNPVSDCMPAALSHAVGLRTHELDKTMIPTDTQMTDVSSQKIRYFTGSETRHLTQSLN